MEKKKKNNYPAKRRKERYEPSKSDLRKAWNVKKHGGTKADICEKLKILKSQYEANSKSFNLFYGLQKLTEKRKNVSLHKTNKSYKTKNINMKNGETLLSIDTLDFDVLKSYVICGYSNKEIADLLGVSKTTFYSFIKENPEVRRAMDIAVKEAGYRVITKGLMRLCEQYDLPYTFTASYMGEITTKQGKKHFAPDMRAIEYFLANKLGWSREPKQDRSNNKGAIMQMLDQMHNGEDYSKVEKTEREDENE